MPFKPTYLYIKQHKITGLLYLGITTGNEQYLLERYNGSGEYWKRHIKKHGKQIDTIWYCLFTEKDELVKCALLCSELWNIVNAKNDSGKKLWANEKPENGTSGGCLKGRSIGKGISKNKGVPQSPEHAAKTAAKKGNAYGKANKGKPAHNKGELWSDEVKAKMRKPKVKVTCPHCSKIGGSNNMYRYHFDKCKQLKELVYI